MSLFDNLVHKNPTLNDIEKFNHLISCLSDEALGIVKAFQISEENYPKAIASFKKVCDNACHIFFDIIRRLFDLSQTTKPSATAKKWTQSPNRNGKNNSISRDFHFGRTMDPPWTNDISIVRLMNFQVQERGFIVIIEKLHH